MRVEFGLFDGDTLLERGEFIVFRQSGCSHFTHFNAAYQLVGETAEILLSAFAPSLGLRNVRLDMPIHVSDDWEAIDLAGLTLGFRCSLDAQPFIQGDAAARRTSTQSLDTGNQMLGICTTPTEAEIAGTHEELRQLSDGIIAVAATSGSEATFAASYEGPDRAKGRLAALVVRHTSGPTLVSVDGTTINVEGASDSLVGFASWFEFPADARNGVHSHFEPLVGDKYHSSDSVPLVICVCGPDV